MRVKGPHDDITHGVMALWLVCEVALLAQRVSKQACRLSHTEPQTSPPTCAVAATTTTMRITYISFSDCWGFTHAAKEPHKCELGP